MNRIDGSRSLGLAGASDNLGSMMAMAVRTGAVLLVCAVRILRSGLVNTRFHLGVGNELRLASRRVDSGAHQQRHQDQERCKRPEAQGGKT